MRSGYRAAAALLVLAVTAGGARAQERLSLPEVVGAVLAGNPDVVVARAASGEAAQRSAQARAAFWPRVDLTYSFQRGNQPVFVFGSLLAQRQFAGADFALGALNDPDPVTNMRTALSVEHIIFDGGRTRGEARAASRGATAAKADERQVRNDLTLSAARAYGHVLRAAGARLAAEAAVAAAEEDARTAEARRDAGTGSEADVLSVQVHVAHMRARAIAAASDERIARAELNRLMGQPLDRQVLIDESVFAPGVSASSISGAALTEQAIGRRPEIERAALRGEIARALQQSARSALLPQIAVQGGYEWNDGRRGSSATAWIVGASVRLNLFSGGANLARVREAAYAADRARAERERAEAAVRLEVLTAAEELSAARARESVSRAAVMQARESQRMIRDRYEAGLAGAADAIRAATAVVEAEAQRINGVVDVMVGEAALQRAAGGQEE